MNPTDLQFIAQAIAAQSESHDPTRQVGAAVAHSGQLVSTGTNRPPEACGLTKRESHDHIFRDPNWKYFLLEHAERNAIQNAIDLGHSVEGSTMYVTLFPCADCARAMAAAGIKRLVAPNPEILTDADKKWQLHYVYAREVFDRANVIVDLFSYNDAVVRLKQAS